MIDYHLTKRNYLEESKKKLRKQLEMSELLLREKQTKIFNFFLLLYIYAFYVVLHLCCSYLF